MQRLDWLLSRFGGYFGVTNYLGGKFSTDREEMGAVLARLTDLGLVYIDDTGAARRALSDSDQMIVVNRMIGAGNDNSVAKRDLDALEKIAARDGEALGKTYAYDATIDAIGAWASDLQSRKIMLAPASSVLRTRGARG
ncbi:MAG: divergent polysaccharide deacetylase family protein [Parvularculaceae bacterium]